MLSTLQLPLSSAVVTAGGERLGRFDRNRRGELDMSQTALAAKLRRDLRTVQAIETGERSRVQATTLA